VPTLTTRLIATTISIAAGLAACSSSPSLSDGDQTRCQSISALADSGDAGDAGEWNDTFIELANADNKDLRAVGQSFVDAPLDDIDQGAPYLKRALDLCGDGGFKAVPADD